MFERLNILSLNVNGLRGDERRSNFFAWLKLSHADLIFLQEVNWSPDCTALWSDQWGFTAIWSKYNAVLSTNRSLFLTHVTDSPIPRSLIVKVSHPSFTEVYFVGSTYFPSDLKECSEFLDSLPLSLPYTLSLLAGDFNIQANPALDHVPAQPKAAPTHWNLLASFLVQWELIDLLRSQSESQIQCTHWQTSGRSRVGSRIDYIFVNPAFTSLFSPLETTVCPFSDHLSLSCAFKVHTNAPHGASTWKFNTSLLRSDSFQADVKKIWDNLQESPLASPQAT